MDETRVPRFVAFVPARGGSRSIRGKNVRPFAGRPLLHWVLDAAAGAAAIDRIVVSTDDDAIAEVAAAHASGRVDVVRRSAETATDTASTESAMVEYAESHDFGHMVLIQATSPTLEARHLDEAIDRFCASEADSLVSTVRQKRFVWEARPGGFVAPTNYDPTDRPRRQDFGGFLVENGAFYISSRESLLRSGSRLHGSVISYEMPPTSYQELDEPDDWRSLEAVQRHRFHARIASAHLAALRAIQLFITDVDGVLTNAGMYYSESGDELKRFNTRDGMGFERLRERGILRGILTGEDTRLVARRAEKLDLDIVHQGSKHKLRDATMEAASFGVDLARVAYVGDDVNDVELMRAVGFSAAPVDASPEAKDAAHYVCRLAGGDGCVREVADLIVLAHALGDA